jgi:hypothetical protein
VAPSQVASGSTAVMASRPRGCCLRSSSGHDPADDPMFAIRSPAYAVSLSRRSN